MPHRRRPIAPLLGAQELLERFRLRLSRPDALIELAFLGLVAGLLAGLTIIALRLLVAWGQVALLPMAVPEDFESLSAIWQFGAPVAGGVLIGLLFYFAAPSSHHVGVGHVLERLAYHQGRLPWANATVQFVGGAISMIAGHAVGREGPSAHLGAASSNLPAQALGLPYNSLRVLAACGAAAGIAASFNTPLAGAAFAIEVLLIEYTVAGFAPVLLATVSATALTRVVLGSDFAHAVPHLAPGPPDELPYVLLVGVLIGLVAGGFNGIFAWVSARGQRFAPWLRPVFGGVLVGLCGLVAPQVLGMGDDTVHSILLGELGIGLLALLLIVKLAASAGGIALGLPGGLIGPTLFIGAAAGGLLGGIGVLLGITDPQGLGMYAMIGMGAMMAGTLQAPLAALIAILELTGEPHFIFPGMLAVVAATVTAGRVGRPESIFQTLLRARGLDYRSDPVSQSLRRVGVASVMDRRVRTLPGRVSAEEADQAIASEPAWLLVRGPDRPEILLAAVDLVRARKEAEDPTELDLHEIPGTRLQTAPIDMRATLMEAEETITATGAEALYVVSRSVPGLTRVYGVLTPDDIRRSYRPG